MCSYFFVLSFMDSAFANLLILESIFRIHYKCFEFNKI
jgi:hypothetical protein